MQNSDNTLNLKQALLELLKVVKKNHYTKNENDSKLSLKVDDIIYQVDKNNLESEIKNLELSDEQIIGIINNEIKALIPNQASSTNQLADKDFVNSSISTATATFRGTYTSKSDFPLINVDINDYLWYDTTDSLGNRKFDKYKYSNGEWVYEYTLNNSSFTEEQWKAINSSATIELINKISINEENINNLNNNKLEKETFNSFKLENNEALNTKVDKIEGKGLSTNDFTNELKEKLNGIEANAQVNTITGVKGDNEVDYRIGNVSISKENIGLGNVDNTSDANKPISIATQQALDLKADKKDVSEVDIDLEGIGTIVSIPENATGYGTIEKLGGKSYKYNQILNNTKATFIENDVTFTNNNNGTITINGNATATTNELNITTSVNFLVDHKYLIAGLKTIEGIYYGVRGFALNHPNDFIFTYNKEWAGSLAIELNINATANNEIIAPQIFDLTDMGIDTTDVKVAKNELLKNGIDVNVYNEYSKSTIKIEYPTNVKILASANYESRDTHNWWDSSLDINKGYVSYDSSYYFLVIIPPNNTLENDLYIEYIDSNGVLTYVKSNDYSNAGTTNRGRAFYLYRDHITNRDYTKFKVYRSMSNFPQTNIINYVSTQLQTNHSWTQENASKWLGLGVSDSNIINYANKKAIVKYGIVDLGTLEWVATSTSNVYETHSLKDYVSYKGFTSSYSNETSWVSASNLANKKILLRSDVVLIRDDTYTDIDTFKNAMSGVMLIYELATPIEIDLSSLEIESHFECESNGSIIHDNIANYKYSFPVSLKGQVELNFEHDKEQQRDIDSLKKEINSLKERIALLESK